MSISPMIWGAGLACALGGAIAGNALGSTPPLARSAVGYFYQTHEAAVGRDTSGELLPDHYPLVTRKGTVPVGELATRGLYSQARYRAYLYPADYALAEPTTEEYRYVDEPVRYASADESVRIGDPEIDAQQRVDAEDQPAAPLELAAGPADVATQGAAKLIDVSATLAMR